MSYQAEHIVWESEEARALPPGLRLLLLRVAHIVNPEHNWELWAEPDTLANYSGLTDVARGLRKLRDAGWLDVVTPGSPGQPTVYRWAHVPAPGPGVPAHRPGVPAHRPGVPAPGPDAPLYTTEVKPNRTEETRARAATRASFEDEFDQVWAHYPRKLNRKGALKAYTARRRAGVPANDLVRAVIGYAAVCQRKGTEKEYILHGATFFGPNERWAEYLELDAVGVQDALTPYERLALEFDAEDQAVPEMLELER